MRILFDQGTPVPLRNFFGGDSVSTAHEKGWSTLTNGELLNRAEGEFDLLITTDRNLRHQQSVAGRKLAIVVLPTTSWPRLRPVAGSIVAFARSARPGEIAEFLM